MRALYEKLYKFIKGTLTEADFAPKVCEEAEEAELLPAPAEAVEATEANEPTVDKNACTEHVSDSPSASATKASEPSECEPDCEESQIPQEPRGARATRFIKKNKKKIAIGLGIAAAVGAAYAIIKAIKGRD